MGRRRRVLYPSDLSPGGELAFEEALDAAKRDDAELMMLHVVEPIPPLADGMYVATKLERRAEAERLARETFEELLGRAKDHEVAAGDWLAEGVPAEEIVRFAEDKRVDLIVMSTHGRTGVRRLFLGSVAARVAATAPCPVMIVRMR